MPSAQERLVESQVHFQAGRLAQAGAIIAEVLRENPNWADALNGMAMVYLASGNPGAALDAATRAIGVEPNTGALWLTRGFAHLYLGRGAEGIADLRRAVELSPDDPRASLGLAKALGTQRRLFEAIEICRKLWSTSVRRREVTPVYANLVSQLGDSSLHWRLLAEAVEAMPDDIELLSAVSSATNSSSDATIQQILGFHRKFGLMLEKRRSGPAPVLSNVKDPERPLRIGIVSSDFEGHNSVSFFMRAWFERMDKTRYPLYAYSVGATADATGMRFQGLATQWRHMPLAPDDSLAAQIRSDQIDIAIDLIGHTGRRSLGAFQPRCAPVQVSYLGYSNTTGMASMDWRIVDSITDPAPGADALATERLWRLDPCFVCYTPDDRLPPVSPLPAFRNGSITFGALSELIKLNEPTFGLWGRVLGAVPGSRLLLKNRASGAPDVERHLRDRLERSGIPRDRVVLRPRTRTYAEHLSTYGEVDISLDSWPYNGTTTICESLVMGVPILGLRPAPEHDRHAARVTMSLLNATGMPELICDSQEDFVARAAKLAADVPALAWMRAGLRGRFLESAACDSAAFARRFEGALRAMWRQHCAAG